MQRMGKKVREGFDPATVAAYERHFGPVTRDPADARFGLVDAEEAEILRSIPTTAASRTKSANDREVLDGLLEKAPEDKKEEKPKAKAKKDE